MKTLLFIFMSLVISNDFSQETIRIDTSKQRKEKEAILILPGFSDSRGRRKHQIKYFQNKGFDVFIPKYKDNKTISKSVSNLIDFYDSQKIEEYKNVHVFSYIIGSWVINEFINSHGKKNISTIIYDRSPIQERAPYIAAENLKLISRIKVGRIVEEMAKTPYPKIEDNNLNIGIIIESKATLLMRVYKKKTLKMGVLEWHVDSLKQSNDDYYYTWLNHDQMYKRFDIIGKEVFQFITTGSFSNEVKKEQYTWDPFVPYKKEGLK